MKLGKLNRRSVQIKKLQDENTRIHEIVENLNDRVMQLEATLENIERVIDLNDIEIIRRKNE